VRWVDLAATSAFCPCESPVYRRLRSNRPLAALRRRVEMVRARMAQQIRGFHVDSLDSLKFKRSYGWQESLVEDRSSPPPNAAARLTLASADGMTSRRRSNAVMLAAVLSRLAEAAERFRLSPGRISHFRRSFHRTPETFHSYPDNGKPTIWFAAESGRPTTILASVKQFSCQ